MMQWLKKKCFLWFFQDDIQDLIDDLWMDVYADAKISEYTTDPYKIGAIDAYVDLMLDYGTPPKIQCDDCLRNIPQDKNHWPELEELTCPYCVAFEELVESIDSSLENKNKEKES